MQGTCKGTSRSDDDAKLAVTRLADTARAGEILALAHRAFGDLPIRFVYRRTKLYANQLTKTQSRPQHGVARLPMRKTSYTNRARVAPFVRSCSR